MNGRNVVLVTVDCLRYDRCGFNGYHRDTTPTLDALSCDSLVYENAFATGPSTAHSLPGLLAGLLSAECGVIDGAIGIPPGRKTVASELQSRGYKTGAIVTNPTAREELNVSMGFEEFRNLDMEEINSEADTGTGEARLAGTIAANLNRLNSQASETIRRREGFGYTAAKWIFLAHRYRQYLRGWPTSRAVSVVDSFLDRLESWEGPFFGWTHLMDLHSPIHPDNVERGGIAAASSPLYCFRADRNRLAQLPDPRYAEIYDSALRAVDEQIGRIVGALKRRGSWSDTVLVVTADHGEALFDRGVYSHPNHYMFDELLRVPLLVRLPGEGPSRITEPTSLGSFHELLMDALGFDEPLLSGDRTSADTPTDDGLVLADGISDIGHTVAARSREFKFITHRGEPIRRKFDWMPEWPWDWTRRDTTFRVQCDPGEHVPLEGTEAPERLRTAADSRMTALDDLPEIEATVDPAVEQRLQELGYHD